MNFNKFSEKFILSKLKTLENGSLKLENYDGKVYQFGDLKKELKADIQINNPKFFTKLIMGGSSALAEAFIKKDFYTSNLTSLIELSARNIKFFLSFRISSNSASFFI